jgi:chemotaxis signal transduction protein
MSTASDLQLSYSRYILTSLDEQILVFPDAYVSEVLLIDRASILSLPFYNPAVLGVVHKQGRIIPLLLLRQALGERTVLIPETLTVVHLTDLAPELEGVGLIVDKLIGSVNLEQFEQMVYPKLNDDGTVRSEVSSTDRAAPDPRYIQIESLLPKLPSQIWQPQRWHLQTIAS